MITNRSRRDAFTLIELVVAMVLMAILTVGLSRLMSDVNRLSTTGRAASQTIDGVPMSLLTATVMSDFRNARGIAIDTDATGLTTVSLAGYVGRHAETGLADWSIDRVTYVHRVIPDRGVAILRSTSSGETRWLTIGSAVLFAQPMADADDRRSSDVDERRAVRLGLPAMPSRMRVGLRDVSGRVLWQRVLRYDEP